MSGGVSSTGIVTGAGSMGATAIGSGAGNAGMTTVRSEMSATAARTTGAAARPSGCGADARAVGISGAPGEGSGLVDGAGGSADVTVVARAGKGAGSR